MSLSKVMLRDMTQIYLDSINQLPKQTTRIQTTKIHVSLDEGITANALVNQIDTAFKTLEQELRNQACGLPLLHIFIETHPYQTYTNPRLDKTLLEFVRIPDTMYGEDGSLCWDGIEFYAYAYVDETLLNQLKENSRG